MRKGIQFQSKTYFGVPARRSAVPRRVQPGGAGPDQPAARAGRHRRGTVLPGHARARGQDARRRRRSRSTTCCCTGCTTAGSDPAGHRAVRRPHCALHRRHQQEYDSIAVGDRLQRLAAVPRPTTRSPGAHGVPVRYAGGILPEGVEKLYFIGLIAPRGPQIPVYGVQAKLVARMIALHEQAGPRGLAFANYFATVQDPELRIDIVRADLERPDGRHRPAAARRWRPPRSRPVWCGAAPAAEAVLTADRRRRSTRRSRRADHRRRPRPGRGARPATRRRGSGRADRRRPGRRRQAHREALRGQRLRRRATFTWTCPTRRRGGRAYDVIDARFGRLDILVNNAGIIHVTAIADEPLEAWNRLLAVNLTGAFLGLHTMIPLLRRGTNPAVVNTSSIFGPSGRHRLRRVRGQQGRPARPDPHRRAGAGPRRHPGQRAGPRRRQHADERGRAARRGRPGDAAGPARARRPSWPRPSRSWSATTPASSPAPSSSSTAGSAPAEPVTGVERRREPARPPTGGQFRRISSASGEESRTLWTGRFGASAGRRPPAEGIAMTYESSQPISPAKAGWSVGLSTTAAVFLLLGGTFQFLTGLAALIHGQFFVWSRIRLQLRRDNLGMDPSPGRRSRVRCGASVCSGLPPGPGLLGIIAAALGAIGTSCGCPISPGGRSS